MPQIDVMDSTWVCTRPATLAARVAEPANWRRWWPDLDLVVDEWRADKGVRWLVRAAKGGALAGSMEVWLEPALDGVIAHYFLRLDPVDGATLGPRRHRRVSDGYRRQAKRVFWALADELDPGRLARVAG